MLTEHRTEGRYLAMNSSSDSPRVLIGEDQQDVQDALHLLLKGAGYSADSAATPDAILTKLDGGRYDLLLMDLNYRRDTTSGSEGLEILGMLRSMPAPPPVIVMTAWGSIDLAVQAMHMGARDFIQKPWDNNHLLHLAEKHIGVHRAEQLRKFKQNYEMEEAIAVQRRLMPTGLPKVPGIDLAGVCQPAGSVAGDYFDVLQLGDKLGLCIADVIGKGLPAALMMSNLQAAVKVTAADWVKPSELCRRVNELACRNGAVDKYITFFYALYEPETRKLSYSNAGHNAPMLIRGNNEVVRLDTRDMVLGQAPDYQYHDASFVLQPGDRVVFYTDGITEAGVDDGDEFGEDRLRELMQRQPNARATDLLASVMSSVTEHCHNNFADDATCLILSID
jgi:sigma-B regulation protein RsbU (phosphoserine phosphatase)